MSEPSIFELLISSGDEIKELSNTVPTMYENVLPLIKSVVEQIPRIFSNTIADEKVISSFVDAEKKWYDAYVESGFSTEQAFALICQKAQVFGNFIKMGNKN